MTVECQQCGGYGYIEVTYHVTRDMATDAGEGSLSAVSRLRVHERASW